MKRHLIILAALLCSPLGDLTAAEPSKPNVVYILSDDVGWVT